MGNNAELARSFKITECDGDVLSDKFTVEMSTSENYQW